MRLEVSYVLFGLLWVVARKPTPPQEEAAGAALSRAEVLRLAAPQ